MCRCTRVAYYARVYTDRECTEIGSHYSCAKNLTVIVRNFKIWIQLSVGQWVSGLKIKIQPNGAYRKRALRVGRIFRRHIIIYIYILYLYAQPETRKHSQYKTTGTRSLAWHTCCRCWTPHTHTCILYVSARAP